MSIIFLVASSDEHVRELVRDNLLNVQNAKVAAEYPLRSRRTCISVSCRIWSVIPTRRLFIDLASDPEGGLKVLERVKQAAPDLYVIATNYTGDGEAIIAAVRAGANDYLVQPVKRMEFRDAIARLEHAPRRAATGSSKLGRIYTFLGAKGGVGTTTLAVNFAGVLAQRKQRAVLLDLDWAANDCAMQVGASPQYTLNEVGENLARLDQALFEGFVTRDPLGFFLVGPPDSLEQRAYFTEPMFREFATFLVEKYDSVVIDAGRSMSDEVTLGALQSSSTIFLVVNQEFPSIRNAQRYMSALVRLGFSQDQLKLVVNEFQKRANPNFATREQIQQTLNQEIFYGIPQSPVVLGSINKGRPFVSDRQSAPDLDRAFRAFVDKATGVKKDDAAKVAKAS